MLAGRREALAAFDDLVATLLRGEHARSILLMGLRGVGKTALLNRLREEATARACLTGKVELEREVSAATTLARELVRLLGALRPAWRTRRSLASALTGFAVLRFRDSVSGIEVAISANDSQDNELASDFTKLVTLVGEAAADHGRGAIVLLDELQYATHSELGALLSGIHDAAQQELPIALVGAGVPQLSSTIAGSRTYAERMFSVLTLETLSPADARRALTVPAQRHDVVYDDIAVDELLEHTGGYPYFIQEYGAHVWDATPGNRVTSDVVAVATPAARSSLDRGFFQIRADRTDNDGKRFLRVLAALGDGPHPIGAVERGMRSRRSRKVVEQLIDAELLFEPDEGTVQFTVLGFADFLLRRYQAR